MNLENNMGTSGMEEELKWINSKIEMLEKYKNGRAKIAVSKQNYDLLEKQLFYMKKYREILAQRLSMIKITRRK